jgi:molybdenum cofactor cytidylyltransferase
MATDDHPHIAAIVLAAGKSSRMGAHKLLLPLGGQALVAHVVLAASASSASSVLVVLGHQADQVAAALPESRATTVVNPDYAEGMATSVRAGIVALPTEATAALILLGDQPLFTTAMIERMLTTSANAQENIIAASYAGRRGNPVLFPRSLFGEVSAVHGDEGARAVVARHANRLVLVEFGDERAALDADAPDDYQRIVAAWEAQSSTGND